MSESIQSLINELVDAIQSEDQDRAQNAASELKNAYKTRQQEEQKIIDKSSIARRDKSLSEQDQDILAGFLETASDIGMKRGAFMLEVASTIASIEEGEDSADAFEGTADTLKNNENQIETEQQTAEKIVQKATIDPSAEILSATATETELELNESTTVEVVIANVGDESATNVTVEIDTTEGLSSNISTDTIGTLTSDQEKNKTYGVSADGGGNQRIDIVIDSDNAGKDVADIDITVPIQSGLSRFDQNNTGQISFDDVTDAIDAYTNNEQIGGQEVEFNEVIEVINAFNNETPV